MAGDALDLHRLRTLIIELLDLMEDNKEFNDQAAKDDTNPRQTPRLSTIYRPELVST
jgi:hypothetical protein